MSGGGRPVRRPPATLRPGRVVAPDGSAAAVLVDDAESPLAWLRSRRDKDGTPLIDPAAYEAGERFRRDYTVAGLVARTTMNWDAFGAPAAGRRPGGADGALRVGEAALEARRRVEAALAAVGPELGGVLVDVLCELRGLGDVERQRGWPIRSGKVVLRMALAALARHYGLAAAATGPAAAARTRRWTAGPRA